MESALPGDAEVRRDPLWGTVRQLAARDLSRSLDGDPGFRALREAGDASAVALFFLDAHRTLLRLEHPRRELTLRSVASDGLGHSHVKLEQSHRGLRVWGAEIVVHLDAELEVYRVNGRYVPTPDRLEARPRLSPEEARSRTAEALDRPLSDHEASEPELLIYPKQSGELALAFLVRTRPSAVQGWQVLVAAEDGHVLARIPSVMTSSGTMLPEGESPGETGESP